MTFRLEPSDTFSHSCKGAKLLEGKVFKLSASADALRTWAESCK